jgi:hypothetical protein
MLSERLRHIRSLAHDSLDKRSMQSRLFLAEAPISSLLVT